MPATTPIARTLPPCAPSRTLPRASTPRWKSDGWLLFLALALALAACSGEDTSPTPAPGDPSTPDPQDPVDPSAPPWESWNERGPLEVQELVLTFTDASRRVASAEDDQPRTLKTSIWFAPAASASGPVILWAHGLGSTRTDSPVVARALASRGYVVAAPDFPLTSRNNTNLQDIRDVVEQPGDLSFVLDQLLVLHGDPTSPLYNRLDAERVGVAGVSLGGVTALLTAWVDAFADPRIRAIASFGAPACYLPRPLFQRDALPMLVAYGTGDAVVDYETQGRQPFLGAPGPALLLTLIDASHTAFGDVVGRALDGTRTHPDVIGCSTIAARIPLDDLGILAESLGGPSAATVTAECQAPCQGDERERTHMRGSRQASIIVASTVAFFEGVFGDGPNVETLASQFDAEADIEARAVSGMQAATPP